MDISRKEQQSCVQPSHELPIMQQCGRGGADSVLQYVANLLLPSKLRMSGREATSNASRRKALENDEAKQGHRKQAHS